jgi:inorganic pyrophosphatase
MPASILASEYSETGVVRVVMTAATADAARGQSPFGCGYLPNTLGDDAAVIGAVVLQPLRMGAGAIVSATPIGALMISVASRDQHEPEREHRMIVVTVASPDRGATKPLSALTRQRLEELVVMRTEADGKRASIDGWEDAQYAADAITRARTAYQRAQACFSPRSPGLSTT